MGGQIIFPWDNNDEPGERSGIVSGLGKVEEVVSSTALNPQGRVMLRRIRNQGEGPDRVKESGKERYTLKGNVDELNKDFCLGILNKTCPFG